MAPPTGLSLSRVVPPAGSLAGGYEAVVIGSGIPHNARCFFGACEATVTQALGGDAVVVIVPPCDSATPSSVQVTVLSASDDALRATTSFSYVKHDASSRPASAKRVVGPVEVKVAAPPEAKPLPPIGHGGVQNDGLLEALEGANGEKRGRQENRNALGVAQQPARGRSPSPAPGREGFVIAKKEAFRQRVMRVFVSSTFLDMAEERDYLAKHVFPELKALADERMVHLTYCDLRWGINQEQSSRNETIAICLRELAATDIFVCMLGDRYGWHQDPLAEKKDITLQKTFDYAATEFPFVDQHRTCSLTELEVRYASLNRAHAVDHARCRFFFRDRDDSLSRVPPGTDASRFSDTQEYARNKLAALKREIEDAGLPVVKNYRGVETVGREVLATVRRELDERFPKGSEPSNLARERQIHEAFADIRSRVYIGGEQYYDVLDGHAQRGDGNPFLCVLGPSGGGKSSLVANWIVRFRSAYPDSFVLMHFIGCSHESTSASAILLRVMSELQEEFGIEGELPTEPENILLLFPTFMQRLGEHSDRPVIIVLDALNQLENDHDALQLQWLPVALPNNCRFVLSAIDNTSAGAGDVNAGKMAVENEKEATVLAALNKRGVATLRVRPLDTATRQQLARDFLRGYNKTLSLEQLSLVCDGASASNPLYLRTLLQELAVFGSFEDLTRAIQQYTAATTNQALFELVLVRLERDYSTWLVSRTFGLVWASRRGLSESELLDMLSADSHTNEERETAAFRFSRLRFAVADYMTRSGLFNFFHDHLRQAVERRYCASEEQVASLRSTIAAYFFRQLSTIPDAPYNIGGSDRAAVRARVAEELPFQLEKNGDKSGLATCVTHLGLLYVLFAPAIRFDLLRYIRTAGQMDVMRALVGNKLNTITQFPDRAIAYDCLSELGALCKTIGEYEAGLTVNKKLYELALAWFGARDTRTVLAKFAMSLSYGNLGRLRGEEGAFRWRREALQELTEIHGPNHLDVAKIMFALADTHYVSKEYEEAYPLYLEALRVRESLLKGDHPALAETYSGMGIILEARGDFEGAEANYMKALSMRERMLGPDHPDVARVCVNLGAMFTNKGMPAATVPLYKRALRIRVKRLGPNHPYTNRIYQNLRRALARISQEVEDQEDIADLLEEIKNAQ